jgi:hypothetical protein
MSDVQVTGHAITLLNSTSFANYAMDMGRRFRGFATLETETVIADGKIKGGKGSGFSGRITKSARIQVVLNPNYTNSVNAQRGRETEVGEYMEEFVAHPRSWGTRIEGTSFVEHKGKRYLEVQVLRSFEASYCIDGQPVPKDVAEALLHPHKGSGRQGTDKAVILRDYNVENIVRVEWTCPDGIAYDIKID